MSTTNIQTYQIITINVLLVFSLLFISIGCTSKDQKLFKDTDKEGVIGEVHTTTYETNIGETGKQLVEVGVLVSSVDVSYIEEKGLAIIKVLSTIENHSRIPLRIGSGNKYIVDSKGNLYAVTDGAGMVLNPSLQGKFEYKFIIANELLKDKLYFAYIDYDDDSNKKKGFKIKWKIKIKDSSDAIPTAGEKLSLLW